MTLGYDGQLFLVAIDRLAADQGGDAVDVVLDGVRRARDAGTGDVELGLLLDDQVSGVQATAAAADGLRVAVTVDDPVADGFELAHGDGFGEHLETRAPDLAVVRLRWNPHDDPDDKKRQALGLTKLGAWLHETDRSLLLELIVPAAAEDLDRVDGDASRYATELRPERTLVAIQELRDLGLEADLWATAGSPDGTEAGAFADLVRDAGRDAVGGLVVAREERSDLAEVLAAAGATPGLRGAILGQPVWGAALAGHGDGSLTREQAVARVADDTIRCIQFYAAATTA